MEPRIPHGFFVQGSFLRFFILCSVRQTEALVKRLLAGPAPMRESSIDPDVQRLEAKLSDRLGAMVKIKPKSSGKGQIIIAYDSLDILDGIISKLKNKG